MLDAIWIDANLATMAGRMPYGAIEGGAIRHRGSPHCLGGSASPALPDHPERIAHAVYSAKGGWITPGLIDCHTHIVFAGDRSRDFEMSLEGAAQAAIAAEGGILSTVRATRAASPEDLSSPERRSACGRSMAEGVTTIEIKSGYGLDVEVELKMLRVARELGERHPVRVATTFLGAHDVPPEFAGRADAYIDFLIETSLPAIAREGLADMVDAALELISFTAPQVERLFAAAKAFGLPVRAHTDQYSDGGGAEVVAHLGGLSADHLEYPARAGVGAMAEAGTVGVMLPGANHTVRVSAFRRSPGSARPGVPMAVAANLYTPGMLPTTSIRTMLEHGLDAVPDDAGGRARRRHAERCEGDRAFLPNAEPWRRKGGGFRRMGYRPAGGTRLPHRLQSMPPSGEGRRRRPSRKRGVILGEVTRGAPAGLHLWKGGRLRAEDHRIRAARTKPDNPRSARPPVPLPGLRRVRLPGHRGERSGRLR